jgi:hypothetical protein
MQKPVETTSGSIFISYAHEDIHRAAELAQLLSEAGVEVWWDDQLQLGDVWRTEIEGRIGAATKLVVLWTDHSRKSDFVRDEASRGKKANKLLQLVLDTGDVPVGFGEFHRRRVADLKDVVPEILVSLGRKPSSGGGFVSTAQTRISLTGLPTTSGKLFGREIEMTRLLDAWESRKTNVFSVIALGGTGKTALLRGFLNALAAKGWLAPATSTPGRPTARARERTATPRPPSSSRRRWSGSVTGPAITSEHDRGVKLGEIVGAKRARRSSTASSRCRTSPFWTRAVCAAARSATMVCAG